MKAQVKVKVKKKRKERKLAWVTSVGRSCFVSTSTLTLTRVISRYGLTSIRIQDGDRGAQAMTNGGVHTYVGVRQGAGNEGIRLKAN
jgi:hypothetical protein